MGAGPGGAARRGDRSRPPLDPRDDFGYLHLVARPVVPDKDLLDRAKGDQDVTRFLNGLFSAAVSDEVFPRGYGEGYSPDLSDNNTFDRRADRWATSRGIGAERDSYGDPGLVLQFEVGLDGGGRLFCGRGQKGFEGTGPSSS